jgi:DNA-binding winged helix-turn-helix (wHTH) protein
MSSRDQTAYTFDGHTLDPRRGCLWRGDREIPLRPKCYTLLCYLVENAGRLVPKEELVVWPNIAVTDDSLARCVSDLRLALRDREQTIIKTVRGRGFLFNGPAPGSPGAAPQNSRQNLAPGAEADMDETAPAPSSASRRARDFGSQIAHRKPASFGGLALPLMDQILSLSALRAGAYEGFYQSTRPYSAVPGQYIHDEILVRTGDDGVLRLKMATGGVLVEGWILPVHSQLYVIGTEFGSGGLVFAILHGVNSIKAEALDGITLSSTFDVGRTPAASAIVLRRVGDLTGDQDVDDAHLMARAAGNPIVQRDAVPENLRRHLARNLTADTSVNVGDGVLRLALSESQARSADLGA